MTALQTVEREAGFPLLCQDFRNVHVVPKFDRCGRIDVVGRKCVNTPAPVTPPVREAMDMPEGMPWKYDDGGRAAARFRGKAGDCTVRAIAIAADLPYRWVYDELGRIAKGSPRDGVTRRVYEHFLADYLGWQWTPTMGIGTGCKVHLTPSEMPTAMQWIARLSRHHCAVVDGVVYDTHDPSRGGTRCVYGLWHPPADWEWSRPEQRREVSS